MSTLREDPLGDPTAEPPDEEVPARLVEVVPDPPQRTELGQFPPGVSGNPGGRKPGLSKRVREMCGGDPAHIANILFDILYDPEAKNSDRIAAAKELLDRGWGKSPTHAPIEGGDPLERTELDKAIRDIADELVARRAHPALDVEVVRRELQNGSREPEA